MEHEKLLTPNIVDRIKKDKKIIAVLVYGSFAKGEEYRDVDICLMLDKKYENLEMSRKRLEYSSLFPNRFDVHIFQQLPIYIRKRILKEGKVLLCKNEQMIYEIAFSTIKEFEFYKKIYDLYLKSMEK